VRSIRLALLVLVKAKVGVLGLLLATKLLGSVVGGLRWIVATARGEGRRVVEVLARGAHSGVFHGLIKLLIAFLSKKMVNKINKRFQYDRFAVAKKYRK